MRRIPARAPRRSAPAAAAFATRPQPPAELRQETIALRFEPGPEVERWIYDVFLNSRSALHNEDHRHLTAARIGVLWTNVANRRQMRRVLATAEIPLSRAGAWQKARHDMQLEEWFGKIPDFLITLHAPSLAAADDATFCAILEHELYHCAQAKDAFGLPRFGPNGPMYALRGHDAEEFVGVVRRYGARDVGTRLLIEAAAERPSVALAAIAGACGTCLAKVA